MDEFFFGDAITIIRNGVIDSIDFNNNNPIVTVSYSDCVNCPNAEQTIRLNIGSNTLILDENGNPLSANNLEPGMSVNVATSSAMTRSIPPQSTAYAIRVTGRPLSNDNIVVGRILEMNRQNRSFTTISDGNISSIIQFNVPDDAQIFDRMGRPMNFSRLMPGLQVWVRHAPFMTASIPPQTTAFEIRVR